MKALRSRQPKGGDSVAGRWQRDGDDVDGPLPPHVPPPTVRHCFVTVTDYIVALGHCKTSRSGVRTAEELPGFIPRVLQRGDVPLLRADEAVLKAMVDGWRAQMVSQRAPSRPDATLSAGSSSSPMSIRGAGAHLILISSSQISDPEKHRSSCPRYGPTATRSRCSVLMSATVDTAGFLSARSSSVTFHLRSVSSGTRLDTPPTMPCPPRGEPSSKPICSTSSTASTTSSTNNTRPAPSAG